MRFTVRLTGVLAILENNFLLDKTIEYLNLHGKCYRYGVTAFLWASCCNRSSSQYVADVLIPYYIHSFLGHIFFTDFVFLHTSKLQQLFWKHLPCNCSIFSKIHCPLRTKKSRWKQNNNNKKIPWCHITLCNKINHFKSRNSFRFYYILKFYGNSTKTLSDTETFSLQNVGWCIRQCQSSAEFKALIWIKDFFFFYLIQ